MRKYTIGFFLILKNLLTANQLPSGDLSDASYSYFQRLPKAELHLHLGGAYPLDYLLSIATNEQKKQLQQNLAALEKSVAYHDVFVFFQLISQIVNTEEKMQKGVEALCHTLQEDGVIYAEIRTGLKNLGNGVEAYLKAVIEGIKSSNPQHFQACVLLSLQRNSSVEMAKTTIDLALKYQHLGVMGIDISGDSTVGQIDDIVPELLRAKEGGLSLVIHMGESPQETEQLRLLKELQPSRIGHGVYLSPEAQEWILQRRIPLEVCLTSSILVKMIDQIDAHPGLQYFREGHPIILCTDDPLLFSTTLSKDLWRAHQQGGLSVEEVTKITQDAFKYSIPNQQRRLRRLVAEPSLCGEKR